MGWIEARHHGDGGARALGTGALDFGVNLNPYGPAPEVVRAARTADLSGYPESSARGAREAWAPLLGCGPNELVFGHGAADLMWLIARVLLGRGDVFAVLRPTFSEPEAAARAAGARVMALPGETTDGPELDFRRVARALRKGGARLVYVCTPNNPTGRHAGMERVAQLARDCPDTWVMVDQSFLALSDFAPELGGRLGRNVIAVRSLTKEHSLAGLRVGYARCAPELAARLETARAAWPTSGPAQAAAVACAEAEQMGFVRQCWKRLRQDREELRAGLMELGLAPMASATCFQLVRVPEAQALVTRLGERHRIAVRDCTSFGLPGYLRLAARPSADRRRLLQAWREEMA